VSLLEVNDLTVTYPGNSDPVVDRLSFAVEGGESVGLVGESGSGKTQTALAILGLLPANAAVSGSIRFDGTELAGAKDAVLRRIRARRVAMIFQDPQAALNPYVSVGKQLGRILIEHRLCRGAAVRQRVLDMLARVGLPDPERQHDAFPHQLSGGMRQRAMIGAALIAEPELIVADEPTTALDVTVQAEILDLIRSLQRESGTALLLITHDLAIVAGQCRRVAVMAAGRAIESGPVAEVFSRPTAAATRALVEALPRIDSEPPRPPEGDSQPVVTVVGLSVSYAEQARRRLRAVAPVSFELCRGETLAVVGESGSGKTSLARAIAGLVRADAGEVRLGGERVDAALDRRPLASRRTLQMVFQDPMSSLNPALQVQDVVGEPLRCHEPGLDSDAMQERVGDALRRVGLDRSLASRYPHELSGGQAQRVAIARALIASPALLICDEAVAALDGTVRREILALLSAEQARTGLAVIFITHDLAVVRSISHKVMVMYLGRVCELAANVALFARPRHPYTRTLLDSVPVPDPAAHAGERPPPGEPASILAPPPGCVFHPRCPHAIDRCSSERPRLQQAGDATVACHRAAELDLAAGPR